MLTTDLSSPLTHSECYFEARFKHYDVRATGVLRNRSKEYPDQAINPLLSLTCTPDQEKIIDCCRDRNPRGEESHQCFSLHGRTNESAQASCAGPGLRECDLLLQRFVRHLDPAFRLNPHLPQSEYQSRRAASQSSQNASIQVGVSLVFDFDASPASAW